MPSVLQLSESSREFISYLTYGNRAKQPAVAIGIAKVLSDNAELPSVQSIRPIANVNLGIIQPTSVKENIEFYFKTKIEVDVALKLNVINEMVVIDITAIKDYLRMFYIARVNTIYPPDCIFLNDRETAILEFFQVSRFVNKEVLHEIVDSYAVITKVYNGTTKLLAETMPLRRPFATA